MSCMVHTPLGTRLVRVGESEGNLLLYIFCLGTACAALLQWPIWTALIGGTAIAAVSAIEQAKLRTRFAAIGAGNLLATAQLASLATGWLAGIASWGLGRFSWWAYWS